MSFYFNCKAKYIGFNQWKFEQNWPRKSKASDHNHCLIIKWQRQGCQPCKKVCSIFRTEKKYFGWKNCIFTHCAIHMWRNKLKEKQYFPKSCSIFEVFSSKNSTKYCKKSNTWHLCTAHRGSCGHLSIHFIHKISLIFTNYLTHSFSLYNSIINVCQIKYSLHVIFWFETRRSIHWKKGQIRNFMKSCLCNSTISQGWSLDFKKPYLPFEYLTDFVQIFTDIIQQFHPFL